MKISSLLRNVSCIDLREENSTPTAVKGLESGAGPRLHYGKFLISKLKKTQGLTFANTLRRILLYEVPTTGITSVKFQTKYIGEHKESSPSSEPSEEQGWRNFGSEAANTGAASQEGLRPSPRERSYAAGFASAEQQFRSQIIHEFSRIPGIYESLLEFTINLESVVLKKNSEYSVIGNVGVSKDLGSGYDATNAYVQARAKPMQSRGEAYATLPQYATITLILPALVGSEIGQSAGAASQSVAQARAKPMQSGAQASPLQSQHKDSITLPTQVAISHIIRAKDLILPSGFSVVYPDQYIATLMGGQIRKSIIEIPETSASLLIVTCCLESHFECLETDLIRGQSSEATVYADVPAGAASQEGQDKETGSAATSPRAGFTERSAGFASTKSLAPSEAPLQLNKKSAPVKKVNYTIENAGEPNQGEQVIFEIWTNGAISPQDAFAYGIQYAVKLFQQFLPEVR